MWGWDEVAAALLGCESGDGGERADGEEVGGGCDE